MEPKNNNNHVITKEDQNRDATLSMAREQYRANPSETNALILANAARNVGHSKLHSYFPEQARSCFLEALPIYERANALYEVFKLKRAIARAESALANYPAAITLFDEAEALLKDKSVIADCLKSGSNARVEEAKNCLYYSIACSRMSQLGKALSRLNQAARIFIIYSKSHYLSACFQGKAIIRMEQGQLKAARTAFNFALKYAKLSKDEKRLYAVKEYNARLELASGNYKKAIKPLDECITWYKNNKSNRSSAYYLRAKCQEKLNLRKQAAEDYDTAIKITEDTRAELEDDYYRQTFFVRKLEIYEAALLNKIAMGDAKGAFNLCQQAKARSFNEKIHKSLGGIESGVEEPELMPVKYEQVSSLLYTNTAFIDFYVSSDKLISFCLTNKSCSCAISDTSNEEVELIVTNIRSFIIMSALDGKGEDEEKPMNWYFGAVSKLLFSKHADMLEKMKLIFISPHAHLHYLPFDVLDIKGKNMLDTYKTAIFPSVRTFVEMHGKGVRKIKNALVVSNPTGDLPSAGSEAQVIAGLLPNVTVMEGKNAQKEAVLSALPAADLIHFAGHSKADIGNPRNSEILVVNELGECVGIMPRDILHLKLKAQLVVLSGCESGLGDVARGDELTCLPRSFLSAGARSVMYSLWDVEDDSTAVLMKEIYTQIANPGTSVTRAMRLAKRKLKASGTSPFLWAGFQMIGF